MELIDRYVYSVTQYLPKDLQEDVGKELRANIEDMLPDDYSEIEVYQVLEKLGNPWKLANEYNPKKRYLIGPGFYENYIAVLKLVIGICITVFMGIAILGWTIETPVGGQYTEKITKLVVDLITASLEGAIQGGIWVTIVFVILERSGVGEGQFPYHNKKWTPKDLPELPFNHKKKISRSEIVVSMFFTILFTALIYLKPQLIAIYFEDTSGNFNAIPLFETKVLQPYLTVFFILAIIQLGISIWKYITASWNLPLAIINAVYNLIICVLISLLFRNHNLLNTEFVSKIAEIMKSSSQTITVWLDRSVIIFIVVFVVVCIWDSVSAIAKSISTKG